MAKPGAKGAIKSAASKPGAGKAAPAKSRAARPPSAKSPSTKFPAAKRATSKRAPVLSADDRLGRLWLAVQEVREGRRDSPRTARLLAAGPPKLAQKVVEEAAEVAIEAVVGRREALINESVDLLYNLVALWNGLKIEPAAVWAEMDRREGALGMAEKLPKTDDV